MIRKETLVTDENISAVLGPDKWDQLQLTERSLRKAGDGSRLITQAEVDIFVSRAMIAGVDRQLHLLNSRFPGERFIKDPTKQNPDFRGTRKLLLALKEELTPEQKPLRSLVRKHHKKTLREKNALQRPHLGL